MSKDKILKEQLQKSKILKHIQTLCHRYRIDSLYVFGSRAKEVFQYVHGSGKRTDREGSDIDVGVMPAKYYALSAKDRVKLTIDLEDLFGVCRVDMVVLPESSPFLALEIIKGELLYAADPDQATEYELYVLRVAGDLAYFEYQRREQLLTGEII